MGDWIMPFRPFPLSSECPFHDISPCSVGLAVSLSMFVLRYLSPCSWFVCMRLLAHLFSCLSSHPVFIKGGLCCCSNASMVRWFVSVSYVFSGWSYIQGDCSGWLPMHFGEMDHLPYRHARFVPFLPWWFSSDQQFLFWWQICGFYMLQWCSFFMITFLFLFEGTFALYLGT